MTGRDLVTASLRLIGVKAAGESLTADEATDGLSALNRMIASWSTEGLIVHAIAAESALTLTPGDATVTMGTGGDIATRPVSIEKAVIRDGSIDYPVKVLSNAEYASISDKSLQGCPGAIYDDGGYPQRTLTLYPVPSDAKQLLLYTKRELSQIATLDTSISLPPGYERALVFNGAVELAPEYSRAVSDVVAAIARDSKAAIKRANHRPSYVRCDAVPAGTRGRFDFTTGGCR